MDGAQLRIAALTPDERQGRMPWADGSGAQLLAVPLGDIERWRINTEIRRVQFVAIHTDWQRDRRYRALIRAAKDEGHMDGPYLFFLIATIALALVRNDSAVGLAPEDMDFPGTIIDEWKFEDSASTAKSFDIAARLAVRVGLLTTLDPNDQSAIGRYGRVITDHERRRSKHGRAPARRAAARARIGVDEDVDGDEDEDKTRIDGDGEGLAGGRHSECDGVSPTTQSARGERHPNDDGLAQPTTTPIAAAEKVAVERAQAPPPKSGRNLKHVELLRQWALQRRIHYGKPPWPANASDMADLTTAVTNVSRDRSTLEQRWRELKEVIEDAADWADDGRGFRRALQDAGFVPQRKKQ